MHFRKLKPLSIIDQESIPGHLFLPLLYLFDSAFSFFSESPNSQINVEHKTVSCPAYNSPNVLKKYKEVNPCSKTITRQCTEWKLPLPPHASVKWLLGSCRHKKKCTPHIHVSICLPPHVSLCHDYSSVFSFFPSNLSHLFSFICCWPTSYDSHSPSGLPLPHGLGAAVQLAPPRCCGCAAVAQGTVPICGDFLITPTGLFVTKCNVTVRQK